MCIFLLFPDNVQNYDFTLKPWEQTKISFLTTKKTEIGVLKKIVRVRQMLFFYVLATDDNTMLSQARQEQF